MITNYYKCVVLFLFVLVSPTLVQAESTINSPDQMFLVSKKSVSQIEVVRHIAKNGVYEVNFVAIIPAKHFTKGERAMRGLWVPSSQQFIFQKYEKTVEIMKCSDWGKENWTFSFIPAKKEINGKHIDIFQEGESYGRDRKPKSACVSAGINSRTCERVTCSKWETRKPNGNFIVKSEFDAISLYKIL